MQSLQLVHVVQRTVVTQPVRNVQALQDRRNLGIVRTTPVSDDLMDCLDRLDDDAFDELMNDDDLADLDICDSWAGRHA